MILTSTRFRFPSRVFACSAVICLFAVLAAAQDLSIATLLKSGTVEQKRDLLLEISRIGNEEQSRLAIVALRDESDIVRATAISAIRHLAPEERAGHLQALLGDNDFVKKEAVLALGKTGTVLAEQLIAALLTADEEPEIEAAAAVAAGELESPQSLIPLLNILSRKPKKSRTFGRRAAAKAIGQIFLASNSKGRVTPENFLPENYKSARRTSTDLEREFALRVLSRVFKNSKESADTRREAAFALGTLGQEGITLLTACTSDPDPYLAEICKEARVTISKNN